MTTTATDSQAVPWARLDDIRRAVQAERPSRLRALLASIARDLDTIFIAALEELRASPFPATDQWGPASTNALHESRALTNFLVHLDTVYTPQWQLDTPRATQIRAILRPYADVGAPSLDVDGFPTTFRPPSPPCTSPTPFPHVRGLFHGSLTTGWPLALALRTWAALPAGHFSSDGRTFWPHPPAGPASDDTPGPCFIIPSPDATVWVAVDGRTSAIRAIHSTRRLCLPTDPRKYTTTKPFPIPLDTNGLPIPPAFRSSALRDHKHNWYKLGDLSTEARTIIEGRFIFPKTWWNIPIVAIRHPNHPSLDRDPAAQACLFPKIVQWAEAGILEVVPADAPQPLCILPCGAVPKKPDSFRLITDGRPVNAFFLDWKVTYTAAAKVSLLLSDRCVTFSIDMHDAYHLTELYGCGQGVVEEIEEYIDHTGSKRQRTKVFWGCSPRTCDGGCDKSMLGICVNGITFRFASAQFGLKTSGCPLATIVRSLSTYVQKKWHLNIGDWVDDLLFVHTTPPHPPCLGATSGCRICQAAVDSCAAKEAAVKAFLPTLGISLSAKGHSSAQFGEFLGLQHDTVRGIYLVPEDRIASIVTLTTTIAALTSSTPRQLAKLRGKLGHYAIALDYLQPVLTTLSVACGTKQLINTPGIDWDAAIPVTSHVKAACAHILSVLPRVAPRGRPIWSTTTSSMYAKFVDTPSSTHTPASPLVIIISYDASPFGYAARARFSDLRDPIVIVGTFPHELEQVQREAHAGVLAVRYLVERLGSALQGATVILRNDCLPALKALFKGSFKSPTLQAFSWELLALHHPLDIHLRTLHVPGTTLVEEGIDHDSRLLATHCQGPACAPFVRDIIHDWASRLGAPITLDLFASQSNALVPRYYSRYPEAGSSGADAFSQGSWGYRLCQCGQYHREFAFAFPPEDLLLQFVAKAQTDRARGLALVPKAIIAAYWVALMRATPRREPLHIFYPRRSPSPLTHAGHWRPPSLALIHFDFGPPPPLRSPLTPPCIRSHLPPASPLTAPTDDLAELLLLRAHQAHQTHPNPLSCSPDQIRDLFFRPTKRTRTTQ